MMYIPRIDVGTLDIVTFHIMDDDGLADTVEVKILFEPVNDAPRVTASNPIYLHQDHGIVSLHFNVFNYQISMGKRIIKCIFSSHIFLTTMQRLTSILGVLQKFICFKTPTLNLF